MTETTLTFRSQIAAPAADVLAWHGNPGAFERLTPPWMDVRVLEAVGGIAPGDWKRLRVAAGPIGVSWTLVHRAADDGTGFVDEQKDGPFQSWRHEHRFLSDGPERSVLEDRITYQLPFGSVGQLVAGRQVERRLDDLFRFRHRAHPDRPCPARRRWLGAATADRHQRRLRVGRQPARSLPAGRRPRRRAARAPATERRRRDFLGSGQPAQIDAASLEGMDAVIHLAGVSIAGGRWTTARKAAILSSRLQGTSLLAETLARLQRPPRVLISASGIGYYGDAGSTPLTESSPPGDGFLAGVCRAWEEATAPAAASGIRVVLPRFGVVLAGSGGLLARLAPAFRFGLGGPLGSGEQFMSWIALDDLLGVLLQAIADDRLAGPVNAVAPHAVSNRAFAETLGRVLGRPAVLRAPAPALRLVAGELADELAPGEPAGAAGSLGGSRFLLRVSDARRRAAARARADSAGIAAPRFRGPVRPRYCRVSRRHVALDAGTTRARGEEGFVLVTRLIVGIRVAVAALMLVVSACHGGKVMAQTEEIEQPPYERHRHGRFDRDSAVWPPAGRGS